MQCFAVAVLVLVSVQHTYLLLITNLQPLLLMPKLYAVFRGRGICATMQRNRDDDVIVPVQVSRLFKGNSKSAENLRSLNCTRKEQLVN